MKNKTGSLLPEEENLRETGDWKQFTLYSRGKHISQSKITGIVAAGTELGTNL